MSADSSLHQHYPNSIGLREQNEPLLYKYDTLQSPRHVRLLRMPDSTSSPVVKGSIVPLDSNDQECYDLVEFPLVTCPNIYQAVSYTWGNSIPDHWVRMSGNRCLPITRTLAVALSQLTRIRTTHFIWVDQICIDQSNLEERSQQVSIMGDIYSRATEVLIWTGTDIDGLSEMKTRLCQSQGFDEFHQQALIQLFSRPWFSRGWTVQEAVLAKKATVLAGDCSLTLQDLETALHKQVVLSTIDSGEKYQMGIASFRTINSLRGGLWRRFFDHGFDGLLNRLGLTQMSDDRDHVFAFLGLNQDPRIVITPDYNISVSESFTNATNAIIEGTGTLDCFRYLPHGQSRSLLLPSWVPDWSTRSDGLQIWSDKDMVDISWRARAAGGFMHRDYSLDPSRTGTLHVHGRIIDHIGTQLPNLGEILDEIPFPPPIHIIAGRQQDFPLTEEQIALIYDYPEKGPSQSLQRRLMSVMVAEKCSADAMLDWYDNARREDLKDNNTNKEDSIDHMANLLEKMRHHELWLTRLGKFVHIQPMRCKEGDVLAVLHGCRVPVLLRAGQNGSYKVRGLCYLEGAMFGEAVTWKEDEADILLLT